MARVCSYCRSSADKVAIKCEACGAILPEASPNDDLTTLEIRRRRAEAEKAELEVQRLRDNSTRAAADGESQRLRLAVATDANLAAKSARVAQRRFWACLIYSIACFVGYAYAMARESDNVGTVLGLLWLIFGACAIVTSIPALVKSAKAKRLKRKLNSLS